MILTVLIAGVIYVFICCVQLLHDCLSSESETYL